MFRGSFTPSVHGHRLRGHRLKTCPADAHRTFDILFFGRDPFSCLVLQELYAARDVWNGIWVVTQPDRWVGRRGSVLSVSPLKRLGESLGLPVHTIPPGKPDFKHWKPPPPFVPSSPNALVDTPRLSTPPLHQLLISASFGRILPSSLLHVFAPRRRLNVHPSLLPSYRGAAPIQHALINGERETGVCVIEMLERKKGIDSGGVFACEPVMIPEDAMFVELRDTLAKKGGRLLVSVLRDMLVDTDKVTPQEYAASAPPAPLITAKDALIDFTTMKAEDIVRRYRALCHQRALTAYYSGRKALQLHSLSVFRSSIPSLPQMAGSAIYDAQSRSLLVRCADGSVVAVPRVKQESRALLDAKEWWNGVKSMGLVDGRVIMFTDGPREGALS